MVVLGSKNSRMRDFFDIHALSSRTPFDGDTLVACTAGDLRATPHCAARRVPIALTPAFAEIDGKRAQWTGFLRTQSPYGGVRRLCQVVDEVSRFVAAGARRGGSERAFQFHLDARQTVGGGVVSGATPASTPCVRRFKPYPAYKDSGVEWLGEIPAHWEVKRLKHLRSARTHSRRPARRPIRRERRCSRGRSRMGGCTTSVTSSSRSSLRAASVPSRGARLVPDGDVCRLDGAHSTLCNRGRQIRSYMVVSTGFAVVRPEAISLPTMPLTRSSAVLRGTSCSKLQGRQRSSHRRER